MYCARAFKYNILLSHHNELLREVDTPMIAPILKIRKLRWFAPAQSTIEAKTRTEMNLNPVLCVCFMAFLLSVFQPLLSIRIICGRLKR